ncbi:helix-turn-helix domain-containing protein [Thalassospira lucentensis]|uniref:helix-turn-helix domain-containing protein n=1 Tax=Thalassospira lucentensis TaxID=168935 RepID=UPI0020CA3F3B|nr:helix-turn-helix domain-containing protein [Thalassospira lucentensis]
MTSQLNGSVLKAFKTLDLFAAGKIELTAQETADALGINMVNAHRFLHTLVHAGALLDQKRDTLFNALMQAAENAQRALYGKD